MFGPFIFHYLPDGFIIKAEFFLKAINILLFQFVDYAIFKHIAHFFAKIGQSIFADLLVQNPLSRFIFYEAGMLYFLDGPPVRFVKDALGDIVFYLFPKQILVRFPLYGLFPSFRSLV